MKPVRISLGIVGVAFLFLGAHSLKSKLDYDRDGQAIKDLIAEYKAMGIPTNGTEYFHKIPDSENAWIEIGPIVMANNRTGINTTFRSGLAFDLATTANKEDLPTLKRYLAVNQSKRDIIAAALLAKPKIQVERDYDLGVMLLYPEVSPFKSVIREFCLEALAAAYEGKDERVLQDLNVAVRLTNYMIESGEWIMIATSYGPRSQIMTTAMRIIEKRPSLETPIRQFLNADGRIKKTQYQTLFQTVFLEQIANARYYDLPIWDKSKPPFPLSLIVKEPEHDAIDVLSIGSVKHGDYLPTSRKMRTYLRNRLESWKPVSEALSRKNFETYEPSEADLRSLKTPEKFIPYELKELFSLGRALDPSEAIVALTKYKQYEQAYHVIWKAMELKDKTGHYPKTLKEIGLPVSAFDTLGGITYTANDKGIALRSVEVSSAGVPRFRVSFPASIVQTKEGNESALKRAMDFRLGKIDFFGNEMKSPATNPRGVPGRTSLHPKTSK